MMAGFKLYLAHKGVVVNAVKRLGVSAHTALFEDLVEEGMLIYLEYYDQYRDGLRGAAQITKFNRLAGNAVYLTLLNRQRKAARHALAEAAGVGAAPTVTTALPRADEAFDVAARLKILVPVLTPEERLVLAQLYDKDQTVSATAHNLRFSRTKVSRLRRNIGIKYREFIG